MTTAASRSGCTVSLLCSRHLEQSPLLIKQVQYVCIAQNQTVAICTVYIALIQMVAVCIHCLDSLVLYNISIQMIAAYLNYLDVDNCTMYTLPKCWRLQYIYIHHLDLIGCRFRLYSSASGKEFLGCFTQLRWHCLFTSTAFRPFQQKIKVNVVVRSVYSITFPKIQIQTKKSN